MKNRGNSDIGENPDQVLPSTEEILTLPVEKLLLRLKSSLNGLTSEEVKRRLELFGYNELPTRKRRTIIVDFLSHFKNLLVVILLIAGLISGFLADMTDMVIIYTIVLFSIIVDFYQEHKAEREAEMLRQRVATKATVLRDGVKKEIRLEEIVPGDIVLLSAGDIVPADARIISAKDLLVDESVLTGESFPIEKTDQPLKSYEPLITKWGNYLFMGTSVVSGAAMALVVKTGSSTEYGKIAKRLARRKGETEFEKELQRFGYMVMQVTFLLVTIVFFINALYMRGVLDSLLFAVALAVGLTPELLPMIVTVTLSKGAVLMAKKKSGCKALSGYTKSWKHGCFMYR
ncbi:MAG: HAD-IC family P-type ATPase [Desulfurococcaceae archaeon]